MVQRNFLYNLQRLFVHPTYFNNKIILKCILFPFAMENDIYRLLIDIYKNFIKKKYNRI